MQKHARIKRVFEHINFELFFKNLYSENKRADRESDAERERQKMF